MRISCAAPEEVGISSEFVLRLLKKLERLDMHSVILMRGNKIFSEVYYAPYKRDTLHRMFSVTKSFTAIAVGMLVGQGRISLEDRIVDYFPEYEPEGGFYSYMKELTIRQMLTMTTCHRGAVYNKHEVGDWSESYFTTEPTHKPGTVFAYDTSSAQVLARLVEKLTGMDMLDYLRTNFLSDTEFSRAAYCMKDGSGTSIGGSGMMATPRDIVCVARTVMDKAREGGFISDAVSAQTSTAAAGSTKDECLGYGYMFWKIDGGYAMNGMGGQLAMCFPDKDFIAVTTADVIGVGGGCQYIIDSVRDEVYANISDVVPQYDSEIVDKLADFVRNACIKPYGVPSDIGKKYTNCEYICEKSMNGVDKMRFKFDRDAGIVEYVIGGRECVLEFGFGKNIEQKFPGYGFECICSAQWCDERTLVIKCRIIDECIGNVTMQIAFGDGYANVMMRKIEETYLAEYNGFSCMKEI